jgi:RimJ/RimL family protein N-acetyltransferase
MPPNGSTSATTERMWLRPFEPDDLDALVALHAIPEFWWYPLQRGQTRDETEEFLTRRLTGWATRGFDLWAAVLRETGVMVGWAGLSEPTFLPEIMPAVEVGWRFDPAVWGRGLATEAGGAGLRFGFETLGLDRIVSAYEPDNVASGRVMTRLGMTLDRDTTHPRLQVPVRVMAITRAAWHGRGALE